MYVKVELAMYNTIKLTSLYSNCLLLRRASLPKTAKRFAGKVSKGVDGPQQSLRLHPQEVNLNIILHEYVPCPP